MTIADGERRIRLLASLPSGTVLTAEEVRKAAVEYSSVPVEGWQDGDNM